MTQGGFYQQQRMNPQAVGIVILLHGAALTALIMAKGEMIGRIIHPPLKIEFIRDKPPPPPNEQHHTQKQTAPSRIDTVIRQVQTPPTPGPIFPGPSLPLPPPLPSGPTLVKADPVPLPPPRPKFEPARAHANLSSYVSNEDYPDAAIRNEQQGTTRFRLAVGPDGRVTGCTVTGSSGSSALDAATCRLMKSRARFTPARDSSGSPTVDNVASAIHWVLPAG